jgi:uncharacterized protein YicC (UPF0701 family)
MTAEGPTYMDRSMRRVVGLLLAAGALATLPLAVASDARADTNGDLAAKVVALIEAGATVVDANRNDCNAMGDKLSQMLSDNADFIDQVKARAEKATPDELRAVSARYQARVEAAMTKAKPGLDRCRTNAKVAAVLRRVNK